VGQGRVAWLILGVELELLALFGAYLISIAHLALADRTGGARGRFTGLAILVGVLAFVTFQVVRHRFWWPATVLAALLANRLAGILTGALASEDARLALLRDAVFGVGIYVLAIGPTFYFPVPTPGTALGPLPPEHAHWCGLPADLVADFFDHPVSGSWCAEPHRALAGGALYFLASALRGARRARSGTWC